MGITLRSKKQPPTTKKQVLYRSAKIFFCVSNKTTKLFLFLFCFFVNRHTDDDELLRAEAPKAKSEEKSTSGTRHGVVPSRCYTRNFRQKGKPIH